MGGVVVVAQSRVMMVAQFRMVVAQSRVVVVLSLGW